MVKAWWGNDVPRRKERSWKPLPAEHHHLRQRDLHDTTIGTQPRGRTQASARPCRPCRPDGPRDDVNSSPGATGVVAARLWGPQTRARLETWEPILPCLRLAEAKLKTSSPVSLSQLRLQTLAIRTHSATPFLQAETAPGAAPLLTRR